MKDNYLDHIIKQALDTIDVPLTSDAWHLMEQEINLNPDLTPDVLSDSVLDETVKNALQDTALPHTPMDWAAMEARIDADDVLSGADVDPHIKEVLENIQVPYTPTAWDMMEAQLDLDDNMAELDATDDVDHIVYNKINNLQPDYDASSWSVLSHKLDGLPANRNRLVYRYKLAEAAMILLLFMTGFNFLPFEKTNTKNTSKENLIIANNNQEKTTESEIVISEEFTVEEIKEAPNNSLLAEANNADDNSKPITNQVAKSKQPNISSPLTIEKASSEGSNVEPVVGTDDDIIIAEHLATTKKLIPNRIETTSNSLLDAIKDAVNTSRLARIIENGLNPSARQVGLKALPVNKAPFLKADEQALPGCLICGLPKTIGIRAAMFWVGDYNHIMTPSDRLFDLEAYTNGSVGYGLGTAVSMTYGRWEVGTGAIFSTKVYRPESLVETLGDFESGYIRYELDQIQLNVLQVPLNVRYNFDNLPNWNFYATAGASLHVVTQTLHDFDSEYSSLPSSQRSPNNGLRLGQLIEENSAFNYKNLSPGWFQEGGSFLENRYFTANVGLGMERSIGARWSIFTQGMYQHTLLSNGFGPNKDRLNTVSIFAGARANIGTKFKKETKY